MSARRMREREQQNTCGGRDGLHVEQISCGDRVVITISREPEPEPEPEPEQGGGLGGLLFGLLVLAIVLALAGQEAGAARQDAGQGAAPVVQEQAAPEPPL